MTQYYDTQIKIAEKFNLPSPGPYDQDWEYCVANPRDLDEYCKYFHHKCKGEIDREIMLMLILQSANDLLESGSDELVVMSTISSVIKTYEGKHNEILEKWSIFDKEGDENSFALSRPLYHEIHKRL